jgi:hypothetical protein
LPPRGISPQIARAEPGSYAAAGFLCSLSCDAGL